MGPNICFTQRITRLITLNQTCSLYFINATLDAANGEYQHDTGLPSCTAVCPPLKSLAGTSSRAQQAGGPVGNLIVLYDGGAKTTAPKFITVYQHPRLRPTWERCDSFDAEQGTAGSMTSTLLSRKTCNSRLS